MFIYNPSGVKTTRGHGPEAPFFRGSGPLEQMAPRNFRGQNIENEKIFDIYKPWPMYSDECY